MIDEVQRVKVEDKIRTGKTYTTDVDLIKEVNPDDGVIEIRKEQKDGYDKIEDVLPQDVDFGPLQQSVARAQGDYTARRPNREERRKTQRIMRSYKRKLDRQRARTNNGK